MPGRRWFPVIVVLSALAPAPSPAPAAPARTVATCDAARVDAAARVARTLGSCGRVDLARGAEGAARQALGRLDGALGVRADGARLRVLRTLATDAGPRVRFQQYVRGVPVRDGQVTVALAPDGEVAYVGSGASPDATLDTRTQVSRARAVAIARARTPTGSLLARAPAVRQVADARPDGTLELAWAVVFDVARPIGEWHVIVSAHDGRVLDAYDAALRADGRGLTYSPNPVQESGDASLRDNDDADSATLARLRIDTPLTRLQDGTALLRGSFVDVARPDGWTCAIRSYVPGRAAGADRSYAYLRGDDAFEEVNAYAAIDRTLSTLAGLGIPPILAAPLPVNVHCLTEDNSYYSAGRLSFGDGGVDDAEDADVVVHELGHAIQDAQVPGWSVGTANRAMGEGFGDFLAAFVHLQDGDPGYQAARRFCLMEWDATAYNARTSTNPGSGCLRWVDGTNERDGSDLGTYAGQTEPHDAGRYWSAALTCVFGGMERTLGTTAARDRILTLVLSHHLALRPNVTFADAVTALREEDRARYGGADIRIVDGCAARRLGVAPPADTTPPTVSGTLSPAAPDGANGWYRSAVGASWSYGDPDTDVVASGCEPAADAADTPGRTITCTATSSGGTTAKELAWRKDGTPPSLRPSLRPALPVAGSPATASAGAADATSGVAAQSCGVPDTRRVGAHSVACSATDAAGNTATQTLAYTVAPASGGVLGTSVLMKATRVRAAADGTVSFRLKTDLAGRVRISARAGRIRFRPSKATFKAGRARTVRLEPARRARAAFRRKLRGGRRVKVVVTFEPARGRARVLTLTVRR